MKQGKVLNSSRFLFKTSVALVFFALLSACANSGMNRVKEISIRYGKVLSVTRVPVPSAAPAGAIIGGFTGLMLARKANPGRQLAAGVGGAALGGLVTHALEGDRRAYRYRIKFRDSFEADYVTENGYLRTSDCVAVERGEYNNLRRVSDEYCRIELPLPPLVKSQQEADQCHAAKKQLLLAEDDATLDQAARKVKILCQF